MSELEVPTDKVVPLELPAGEVLGQRWRVVRTLGRGPHGTVHLCLDMRENAPAALKLLTNASRADGPFAARFERELRELTRLKHDGLARVLDFGWKGDTPFVVSAFVDAPPLDAWLAPKGRVSPEELLQLARQLCGAVRFIHDNALVHRSLKPSNVHLTPEGVATVLDLGTARDLSRPASELPDFAGDVRFLAPEQLRAEPVDHRADVYALGALLFFAATGRSPVESVPALSPPDASALFPDIPASVSAALLRAMAKNPVDRFPGADGLLAALEQAYVAPAPEVGSPAAGAPQRFGRYRLLRKIATGGMAEVFLAAAEGVMGFEKKVAVKRILPSLAEDPKFVERFVKEAQWVARLNHPNIVQIFDCGQAEGTYYIAMEYVDGPHLKALGNHLARKGPADIPLCVRVLAYAAEGLGYAHRFRNPETGEPAGLIHRDISPENILISRNGAVKVVDFGIAKAVDSRTKSTTLRGKYAYMAPEQVRALKTDARADVYSLAVVLYELLTNKRPYNAATEPATLRAIVDDPPIPIQEQRADVPDELARIIARALDKNPDNRPADGAELSDELRSYLAATSRPIEASELAQLVASFDERPGTVSIIAPGLEHTLESPTTPARPGARASGPKPNATPAAPPERASGPKLRAGAARESGPHAAVTSERPSGSRIRTGAARESGSLPVLTPTAMPDATVMQTAPVSPPVLSPSADRTTVQPTPQRPAVAGSRAPSFPRLMALAMPRPPSDVGSFWRSPVRRRTAAGAGLLALGTLAFLSIVQAAKTPPPEKESPPQNHRYVVGSEGGQGGQGGTGGVSVGGGPGAGGGGGSPSGGPGRPPPQLDKRGASAHVRFDGPKNAQVIVDDQVLGPSPGSIALRPGLHSAVFIQGRLRSRQEFMVQPGASIIVRP